MIKVILVGCNGLMGDYITARIEKSNDIEIVAGVDKFLEKQKKYPIFSNISDVDICADVIIDFSSPVLLDSILEKAKKDNLAVVIGTTGIDENGVEEIKNASKIVPIFFTFNMSLGINLLVELSKKATKVLGEDFDVEIIEKHHNQKVDAPSGTAFMLANAISKISKNEMHFQYDRHSKRAKREKNEIGIHSVRGGNIVGEHEVIFAGKDEVITLSHSAYSKDVFALGAVNASKFIVGQSAGLYDMSSMLED